MFHWSYVTFTIKTVNKHHGYKMCFYYAYRQDFWYHMLENLYCDECEQYREHQNHLNETKFSIILIEITKNIIFEGNIFENEFYWFASPYGLLITLLVFPLIGSQLWHFRFPSSFRPFIFYFRFTSIMEKIA